MLKNILRVRELRINRPSQHFLHAIAKVPFAHSRHRRIDGDHQRIEPSLSRTLDRGLGSCAPTHQIQLKPRRTFRRPTNVFQLVPGNCRKRVAGSPTAPPTPPPPSSPRLPHPPTPT